MGATVERYFTRVGGSYARGTTIDGYLSDEDNQALHEVWLPDWPDKLGFRGGESAITCEAILEIPEAEFIKAFRSKYGRKKVVGEQANRILAVAKNNAG